MSFRQRTVVGTIFDSKGSPVKQGKVTFKLTKGLGYTPTHTIIDRIAEATTDNNGVFSILLWCDEDSETPVDYSVQFPVADNGPSDTSHVGTFSLRYSAAPINISELINSDNGVPVPWGWYSADSLVGADASSQFLWPDRTTKGHDLIMAGTSSPTLKLNQINGLPVVRFSGGGDHGYVGVSHPVTLYDVFFVMKYRGATFQALQKMAFGDIDSEILIGIAGDVVWFPLTNTEYRRNNVLQNAAAAPGPMDVFDVIHLHFTAGFPFNGVINIANSASQGYPSPIDVAEFIPYDVSLTPEVYSVKAFELMAKYGIG